MGVTIQSVWSTCLLLKTKTHLSECKLACGQQMNLWSSGYKHYKDMGGKTMLLEIVNNLQKRAAEIMQSIRCKWTSQRHSLWQSLTHPTVWLRKRNQRDTQCLYLFLYLYLHLYQNMNKNITRPMIGGYAAIPNNPIAGFTAIRNNPAAALTSNNKW